MKNKPILAIIVTVFILSLIAVVANTNSKVELHQSELRTKQQEIDLLQQKLEQNEETKAKNQKELDKKLQENKKLQDEIKALQAKKAEEQRLAQEKAKNVVYAAERASVSVSGTCADWIAQAGITDVANAVDLINRESGCNPYAVNPSSGACNVAQELPCGKSGCSLGDGACSVKWMNSYVLGRYGSWAGAVAFHNLNGWY